MAAPLVSLSPFQGFREQAIRQETPAQRFECQGLGFTQGCQGLAAGRHKLLPLVSLLMCVAATASNVVLCTASKGACRNGITASC